MPDKAIDLLDQAAARVKLVGPRPGRSTDPELEAELHAAQA
ncbi:hypothetical protein ACPA9J_32755 [Pseudomonas aeruginosa]